MYERFSDRARKVMQLANQEAQRFNHEYIGTEHILLGLVKIGQGVAADVLKNLDVDLRKIRLEVEKIVQTGPGGDQVVLGKLPHTPRAKKTIECSVEEARALNHNYVGTEHLLLGLLREGQGVAVQVLNNLGVKIEAVRQEVVKILGISPSLEQPQPQDFKKMAEDFMAASTKTYHWTHDESLREKQPPTSHLDWILEPREPIHVQQGGKSNAIVTTAISTLSLKPGDILCVQVAKESLSGAEEFFKRFVPEGVKLMVIPDNVKLNKIEVAATTISGAAVGNGFNIAGYPQPTAMNICGPAEIFGKHHAAAVAEQHIPMHELMRDKLLYGKDEAVRPADTAKMWENVGLHKQIKGQLLHGMTDPVAEPDKDDPEPIVVTPPTLPKELL